MSKDSPTTLSPAAFGLRAHPRLEVRPLYLSINRRVVDLAELLSLSWTIDC